MPFIRELLRVLLRTPSGWRVARPVDLDRLYLLQKKLNSIKFPAKVSLQMPRQRPAITGLERF